MLSKYISGKDGSALLDKLAREGRGGKGQVEKGRGKKEESGAERDGPPSFTPFGPMVRGLSVNICGIYSQQKYLYRVHL